MMVDDGDGFGKAGMGTTYTEFTFYNRIDQHLLRDWTLPPVSPLVTNVISIN